MKVRNSDNIFSRHIRLGVLLLLAGLFIAGFARGAQAAVVICVGDFYIEDDNGKVSYCKRSTDEQAGLYVEIGSGEVLSALPQDSGISYDPTTKTVTLNNFSLSTPYCNPIAFSAFDEDKEVKAHLVISGNCSLRYTGSEEVRLMVRAIDTNLDHLYIEGSGTMKVQGFADFVQSYQNHRENGPGALFPSQISISGIHLETDGRAVYAGFGQCTLDGVTMKLKNANSSTWAGILANDDFRSDHGLVIRNSEIEISGYKTQTLSGYSMVINENIYGGNGKAEYKLTMKDLKNYYYSEDVKSIAYQYFQEPYLLITTKDLGLPEKKPENTAQPETSLKGTTQTVSSQKYRVLTDNTVSYVGSVTKNPTKLSIPKSVKIKNKTYKVTEIGAKAMKGNKRLTSLSIGANVTKIGKNAFNGCTALKTVTGGKNVDTIAESAFSGCTQLTKFTFYSKVKKIGSKAFYKCEKLKSVTFKTKLLTSKTIGSKAFTGTYAKATVKVPKAVYKTYVKLLKSRGFGKKVKYKEG